MSFAAWTLNTAWMLSCQGEAAAFRRATQAVSSAQAEVLRRILQANRGTIYGQHYGFDGIRTPADFQSRVPAVQYADLVPWIDRIAAGEGNLLTAEAVERFVPTSGTTSAEKLVPYTASLRRQFQRGIAAWIGNLFRERPAVRRGRAYWSISPALGAERKTPGATSIGLPDDSAYLGRFERLAMGRLLAVPGKVGRLTDITAVRYATLLFMLAADDLSLISVWNPSFLTLLVAPLRQWGDRLGLDLRNGTLSPPLATIDPSLAKRIRPHPRRAQQFAQLLKHTGNDSELLRSLWPSLALISCWTDAAAGQFLVPMKQLFPDVEIQAKGLIATEGFVSLPQCGQAGAALALRSHFLEFAEADSPDRIRLAHQLDVGERYRVLLTTGGGLYRYQLNDEVEVTGFLRECPLIRFLGKADRTSDLVGDKLSELQVHAALASLWQRLHLQPTFALLVPVLEPTPRYRLYVQGVPVSMLRSIAARLEQALGANPYYCHAVNFGQLAPVEVLLLDPSLSGAAIYERQCLARGQRAGDIKPAVLDRWTGWPTLFELAPPRAVADHAR